MTLTPVQLGRVGAAEAALDASLANDDPRKYAMHNGFLEVVVADLLGLIGELVGPSPAHTAAHREADRT